jgi:two-component system phosphate regulon response regulator PhoB
VTVNGEVVRMGPTEFRLLELFMSHPDQAFNRTQLRVLLWGRKACVDERTVDVHVLRLRKALRPFGAHTTVQTVRSVGYRFSVRA